MTRDDSPTVPTGSNIWPGTLALPSRRPASKAVRITLTAGPRPAREPPPRPSSGATETVPNIGQQVATYLASNTPTAGQLYTIWGGANDFLNAGQTNPLIPVENIAAEITALANAGAKQFLIPNLPPLGAVPAASSMSAATIQGLNTLSTAFDAVLAAEAPQLAKNLGVQIHILDVNSLFNNVLADPSLYGLKNVTARPISTGSNGRVSSSGTRSIRRRRSTRSSAASRPSPSPNPRR